MKTLISILFPIIFGSTGIDFLTSLQSEASLKDHKQDQIEIATLAGGCFWCTEAVFERVEGVIDVYSGYTGGKEANPTYRQVSYGRTTHAEAIQIKFDPAVISFNEILDIFFTVAHDPRQLNRQGPDVGEQYRSAAYYHNQEQKLLIEKSIQKFNQDKYDGKIVTEIKPFDKWWMAEEYHQDYYELNPGNPYIINVAKPKVKKLMIKFPDQIKEKYKNSGS